jgi:hypothetical protein
MVTTVSPVYEITALHFSDLTCATRHSNMAEAHGRTMNVLIIMVIIKGKAHSKGKYMYSSPISITSEQYRGGWSTPHPGRFTTGRRSDNHNTGGWVGPRGGLARCRKSRPPPQNGIRSPDRPARSESIYRLRYPGPP